MIGSRVVMVVLCVLTLVAPTPMVRSTSDDVRPSAEHGTTQLSRSARIARQLGIDSTFIAYLMESSRVAVNDRFVRINATNYAHRTDYSHNYNDKGIRAVRAFLTKNAGTLEDAQELYGVPPEVIAALLWVETKHGTNTGSNNVASVFLSVLLSCEPEYLEVNTNAVMVAKSIDSSKVDSVRSAIERRAVRKMLWAADQLRSLHEMRTRRSIDVASLTGSWAGAFGFSQFIPSSYMSWAVDGDSNGVIDLFTTVDAIHSVANYLTKNGWSEKETGQRAAVFHYNNSTDYVNAVLTLASRARLPAAQPDERGAR